MIPRRRESFSFPRREFVEIAMAFQEGLHRMRDDNLLGLFVPG